MLSNENENEETSNNLVSFTFNNLVCYKCKSNLDDNDDNVMCEYCCNRICESCNLDGAAMYMHYTNYRNYSYHNKSICLICAKNDEIYPCELLVALTDWRSLFKKYDKQTKYITELEAEIKLLKTMFDFCPGGDGYIAARDNFKQMVKIYNTIDDNQYNDYNDCEDDD
jgi:superfamily II helicase